MEARHGHSTFEPRSAVTERSSHTGRPAAGGRRREGPGKEGITARRTATCARERAQIARGTKPLIGRAGTAFLPARPCKEGNPSCIAVSAKETGRVHDDCFRPARLSVTTLHLDDGRIANRVLVVEPDQHTCAVHRQLLEQIGCEVVEAFDGRDALVKALTCQPALVLTEIDLPFLDGHALCELLRRDSTTRTVPILSSRPKGVALSSAAHEPRVLMPSWPNQQRSMRCSLTYGTCSLLLANRTARR